MVKNIDIRNGWVLLFSKRDEKSWFPLYDMEPMDFILKRFKELGIAVFILSKGSCKYFVFPSEKDATKAIQYYEGMYKGWSKEMKQSSGMIDLEWQIGPAHNYLSKDYYKKGPNKYFNEDKERKDTATGDEWKDQVDGSDGNEWKNG
jgi:hypothetical protein